MASTYLSYLLVGIVSINLLPFTRAVNSGCITYDKTDPKVCLECKTGFILNKTTQSCDQCTYACVSCTGTTTNCTECVKGFALSETTNSCSPCSETCVLCEGSGDNCTLCPSKFYLKEGKCLECGIPNCHTCSDSTARCTLCNFGYQLKGGACQREGEVSTQSGNGGGELGVWFFVGIFGVFTLIIAVVLSLRCLGGGDKAAK